MAGEEIAVARRHAQAVLEKAILIVYGPGVEHGLYDMAVKILGETDEWKQCQITDNLFRRGFLQRDYAARKLCLSSKGQAALSLLDKVYAEGTLQL